MKRLAFLLPILLLISAGCNAQHSVTTSLMQITITPPPTPSPVPTTGFTGCVATGTATNDCQYALAKLVVPAGTTSCQASNGSNYTILPPAASLTNLVYVDPTSNGETACVVGQTIWNGQYSVASAPAGPFVMPSNPTAPAVSGTVAQQTSSLTVPNVMLDGTPMFAVAQTANSPVFSASISGKVIQVKSGTYGSFDSIPPSNQNHHTWTPENPKE
jgi:hypothetical protein